MSETGQTPRRLPPIDRADIIFGAGAVVTIIGLVLLSSPAVGLVLTGLVICLAAIIVSSGRSA